MIIQNIANYLHHLSLSCKENLARVKHIPLSNFSLHNGNSLNLHILPEVKKKKINDMKAFQFVGYNCASINNHSVFLLTTTVVSEIYCNKNLRFK